MKVTVSLKERSYDIHIGQGLLRQCGGYVHALGGSNKVLIVTDDNVAPLYLKTVQTSLESAGIHVSSLVFPHGEGTKSLASLSALYESLAGAGITRSDLVLALGGGVIGDLAGLAAATWLRSVRFVQVPTTLLAQVDSSVGGKVAIDLPQGKNLVGAFHQPSLVLCDPDTLNTLSPLFWRDGLGEVIKYGCIMDEELFLLLEQLAPLGREALMQNMDAILAHCIQNKADIVEKDEHDTGLRMILNFGHTMAHAIEKCQNYAGETHGHAVAIGMQAITEASERKGLTQPGTSARLKKLLEAFDLPVRMPDLPIEDLLCAMRMDKKNIRDTLHLVILDKIGHCRIIEETPAFFLH